MLYNNVIVGEFVSRPNRFVANVLIDGKNEIVHVKNTGRCQELLLPGCKVWLSEGENPLRKTRYDLICVEKKRENLDPLMINMDSMAPNAVAFEYFSKKNMYYAFDNLKREVRFGESRIDLCGSVGDKKVFIEVKGVTLEKDGWALFPDAPTERGVKHLYELCSVVEQGHEAMALFVIQMKGIRCFSPNEAMHSKFAEALRHARDCGVQIVAMDCIVTPDSIRIDEQVPVIL